MVVIGGSCVILGLVMLLPLDIANSRGGGGGINTDIFYQVLLILYFVFLVFLIPFMMLLYETDEEKSMISRIFRSLCQLSVFVAVVVVFSFIAYGSMKEATLTEFYSTSYASFQTSESDMKISPQTPLNDIDYKVPPFLFMMVFWFFFGWFVFVLFGGIGLISFPLDLILDYFYRPKPRTASEIANRKIMLRRKCEELMSYTEALKGSLQNMEEREGMISRWRAKRQHNSKEKLLKKEMSQLE